MSNASCLPKERMELWLSVRSEDRRVRHLAAASEARVARSHAQRLTPMKQTMMGLPLFCTHPFALRLTLLSLSACFGVFVVRRAFRDGLGGLGVWRVKPAAHVAIVFCIWRRCGADVTTVADWLRIDEAELSNPSAAKLRSPCQITWWPA